MHPAKKSEQREASALDDMTSSPHPAQHYSDVGDGIDSGHKTVTTNNGDVAITAYGMLIYKCIASGTAAHLQDRASRSPVLVTTPLAF